ncbi:FAD-dependent monooxygenase [Guyparkeria hydrothermalis]|uniref:FAD-dependent monooxygenase n=1 Tax=Guyparkeria hydrothermalis TaxID=923 RepID=UPI00202235A8|nr:FAD-dependent monooxygenase [Guyparkeria hydrothermalis]MCL7751983.1 FAD-dependent monooxygenase [Guyparkeria hydrothermalis]
MTRDVADRPQEFDADVMIVGGGMVGGVLARALAADGWSVEVVEPRRPDESASFDRRLTAVADAGWQYLDTLGLVDAPLAAAAERIREVRVFDRGHFGLTRITARSAGVEALGYVMPNRALGERLESLLDGPPVGEGSVRYHRPARYRRHATDADGVSVEIHHDDDGTLTRRARLVVAADGAESAVRERADMAVTRREYDQVATVATAMPARAHDGVAYECFTTGGPLAVLPAAGGRVSLVWVARRAEAERLAGLDDAAFGEAVDEAFGHRLGGFSGLSPRGQYPLTLVTANEPVADRLVVLGNAAHALHPVAGQGFNLCLRDIRDLARVLRADRGAPVDPGDPARLERYRSLRAADYRRTIGLTDGLVRGFSLDLPGLGHLRGGTLSFFDGLLPLKNRLVRATRGIA